MVSNLSRFFLKRGIAVLCLCVFIAQGAEAASDAETGVRETVALGEAAEMHLPTDRSLTPWVQDPAIFGKDEGDRTEMREVVEQDVKTIKLDNLVPPIHFALGRGFPPCPGRNGWAEPGCRAGWA